MSLEEFVIYSETVEEDYRKEHSDESNDDE